MSRRRKIPSSACLAFCLEASAGCTVTRPVRRLDLTIVPSGHAGLEALSRHFEICSARNKLRSNVLAMASISPDARRRSLSESCKLSYMATLGEDSEEPAYLPPPEEPVDDHHPVVLAVHHGPEPLLALEHRSKSESFICTAQGIVFEDAKSEYSAKLSNLVALAANNALGTQSNVLLAKKALRYRKAMERRRIME